MTLIQSAIMSITICAIIYIIYCLASMKTEFTNEYKSHWFRLAENDIKSALNKESIVGKAKNVILFIGDGMGPTTVTAARIYGKSETGHLAFEKFDNIGALKTYSANKLVPDSCSTATAMFCGVKANHKTSGVDPSVNLNDCESSLNSEAQLESIINWGQKSGKFTGFITTTRVTHATPSALFAHTPNRGWECESTMPKNATKCKDIARQLVENEPGRNINVIMGGGRQCLQSNVKGSDTDPIDTWSCYSKDGRNLISDWQKDKSNRNLKHALITNNKELDNLDLTTDFVLGIFANGHLKMNYVRDRGPEGMPSLANMTSKAIQMLLKKPNGFILMVEGGLIDFGHHRGHAKQALDETVAFSDAVQVALDLTSPKETLIIVTSDHSHSMILSGYSSRGTSILGVAQNSKIDNQPYTALLYGTGGPNNYRFNISSNGKVLRHDPSTEDTDNFEYSQQSAVLTDEVTHGGTDVLVYAKGPMAHLFNSVHEQTYVAYVIGYAAGIGPFQNLSSGAENVNAFCYISILLLLISLIKM